MAMTINDLRTLADQVGIASKVVPDGTALLLNVEGAIIAVEVADEGRIVDMTVINWVKCLHDSPHRDAVLRVLHELNSRARAVRFSWRCWRDPANPQVEPDSGIYIRCELFIVDNKLTSLQFVEYIKALLGWYFRTGPRVQKTVETGIDPGDAPPAAPASGAAANQPIDKL